MSKIGSRLPLVICIKVIFSEHTYIFTLLPGLQLGCHEVNSISSYDFYSQLFFNLTIDLHNSEMPQVLY